MAYSDSSLFRLSRSFAIAGLLISAVFSAGAQTAFTETFASPSSTTWSYGSGVQINTSIWKVYNNGNFGARITGGLLEVTSRRSSSAHGQAFVYVPCGGAGSQFDNGYYNPVLANNSGVVTWTFNMRRETSTSSTSGFSCSSASSQNYVTTGLGFVLATNSESGILSSTGNCNPNGTAVGYAVLFGGNLTPRIVSFTNGINNGTLANIAVWGSNISQGNYMSIKVTYDPSNNMWSIQARNDGTSAFANPVAGTYGNPVTGVNSTYTSQPLNFMGPYFQSGCIGVCDEASSGYIARFDNINVTAPQLCVPPVVSISGASGICAGNQITLTANITSSASAIQSYQWQLNGVNIPGGIDSTLQVTAGGTYTVSVIDALGCPATSVNFPVSLNMLPTVSVSGVLLSCVGDSTLLTANSVGGSGTITGYQWHLNGVDIPGANGNTVYAAAAGSYSVTLTTSVGCTSTSAGVNVVQVATPVAGFNANINGTTVGLTNTSQGGTSYVWDFGDGSPTETSASTMHVYAMDGTYTVTLIASNFCGSDTITQTITITTTGIASTSEKLDLKIYPNPASDMLNVSLGVTGRQTIHLKMLDSKGNMVFSNELRCNSGNCSTSIELSTLANGYYMLQVTGKKSKLQQGFVISH